MKIVKIIAAAALAVTGVAGTTVASAAAVQNGYGYGNRDNHRDDNYRDQSRWDRGDRGDHGRHRGWEQGRHRGWDKHRGYDRGNYYNRSHRVCWTEWHRYTGRTTVCRRR